MSGADREEVQKLALGGAVAAGGALFLGARLFNMLRRK